MLVLSSSHASSIFDAAHIVHLGEQFSAAIAERRLDRVEKVSLQLRELQREAFRGNRAQLFTRILYLQIQIVQQLTAEKQAHLLAIAFEGGHQTVAEIMWMAENDDKGILAAWLIRVANLSRTCEVHSIDCAKIIPFRAAVFQDLSAEYKIDCRGDAFQPKVLWRDIENAFLEKEQARFKLLIFNNLVYALEYALSQKDYITLAEYVFQYALFLQKIFKMKSPNTIELSTFLLGKVEIDSDSMVGIPLAHLMDEENLGLLCQLLINKMNMIGEIRRNLGIINLEFREDLVKVLATMPNVNLYDVSFEQSVAQFLEALRDAKSQDQLAGYYIRVELLMENAFNRNNPDEFAGMVLYLASQAIVFLKEEGRIEFFQLLFDDYEDIIELAGDSSLGDLALGILAELDLAEFAATAGWEAQQLVSFRRDCCIALTKQVESLERSGNIIEGSPKKNGVIEPTMAQLNVRLNTAYLARDAKQMAEIVNDLVAIVEQKYSENNEQALVNHFDDLRASEAEAITIALAEKDKDALSKAVLARVLRDYQYKSSGELLKKTTGAEEFEYREQEEEYPGTWVPLVRFAEFSPNIAKFHVEVCKELGIGVTAYKYDSSTTWAWRDAEIIELEKCSASLAGYLNGLEEALTGSKIDVLKEKRLVRRQLLDIAFLRSDHELLQSVIELDVKVLEAAKGSGRWLNAMVLVNLTSNDCAAYADLIERQRDQELLWHLVADVDVTSTYVYSCTKEKNSLQVRELKSKVLENLGCLSPVKAAQFLEVFRRQLATGRIGSELEYQTEIFICSPLFFVSARDEQHSSNLTSNRIFALLKIVREELGNKNPSLFRQGLFTALPFQDLDRKDLYHFMENENLGIVLWEILNKELLEDDFVLKNQLKGDEVHKLKGQLANAFVRMLPAMTEGEIASVLALDLEDVREETVALLPSRSDILSAMDGFFSNSHLSIKEFVLFSHQLQAILSQCFQDNNTELFSALFVAFAQKMEAAYRECRYVPTMLPYVMTVNDRTKTPVYYSKMVTGDIQGMVETLVAAFHFEKSAAQYYVSFGQAEERVARLSSFVQGVLAKSAASLQDNLLLASETIQTYRQQVSVIPTEKEVSLCAEELQVDFRLLYLSRNIKGAGKFIDEWSVAANKAYCEGNNELLLIQLFKMSRTGINESLAYLRSGNLSGFKIWLLRHSLQQAKFIENIDYASDNEFTAEVFDVLGVNELDAFQGNLKLSQNQDYDKLVTSFRRLANSGVSLEIYESALESLAKHPKFHQALLAQQPCDTDSAKYQAIYDKLLSIWHISICAHLFAVLREDIPFAGLRIDWEGSHGTSMVDYLVAAHDKWANANDNNAITQAANANLKDGPLLKADLGQISTLSAQKKPMCIPVGLTDDNWNGEKHAVSVTVIDDLILVSDRGVDEFSGIKIYRIPNKIMLENFIVALAGSMDTSLDYNIYLTRLSLLDLSLLIKIPLPAQMRGNCGMSSSAEPIVFGAMVAACLSHLEDAGEDKSNVLVVEKAVRLAKKQQERFLSHVRSQNTKDLVKYFESYQEQPQVLYAHLYLLSLRRYPSRETAAVLRKLIAGADVWSAYRDCVHYVHEHYAEAARTTNQTFEPKEASQLTCALVDAFLFKSQQELDRIQEIVKRALVWGFKPTKNYVAATGALLSTSHRQALRDALMNVSTQPGFAPVLYEIGQKAIREGVIRSIAWEQRAEFAAWYPTRLELNCSSEEFIDYLRKEVRSWGGRGAEQQLEACLGASARGESHFSLGSAPQSSRELCFFPKGLSEEGRVTPVVQKVIHKI